MTRNEREALIRSYLDGTLNSDQEQEFFINVALDAELRTELKAHRTIDEAIRKDREVDAGEILQLQQGVMAALAGAAAGAPAAGSSVGRRPLAVDAGAGSKPVPEATADGARRDVEHVWFGKLTTTLMLTAAAILLACLFLPRLMAPSTPRDPRPEPRAAPPGGRTTREPMLPGAVTGGGQASGAERSGRAESDASGRNDSLARPAAGKAPMDRGASGMERRSIDPSAAPTSAARTNMARTSTTRMSAADTNDALMHDRDTNDSIGREDSLGIGVDLRIGGDR